MTSGRNQRRPYRNGSSPGADTTVVACTGDFIDNTIEVWQKHTERKLTREDGREIIENMTGFLRILQEWDRAERAEEAATKRAADRPRRKSAAADRPDAGQPSTCLSYLAKS